MEIKDVFISVVVVLVAVVAVFSWFGDWNAAYGDDVGSTFNNTVSRTALLNNVSRIGGNVANNTLTTPGSAPTSQEEGAWSKARSTLSLLNDLLGIIPSLLRDFAGIIGIPNVYQDAAVYTFVFVFGLTIMFIILLGVKSLFGG